MNANVKYNFKVIHNINFELFEVKSDATSTYEIEFEKLESKDFKIEIRRKDFKINDKKVELKFERIAYEYNKAIFPVLFDVKNGNFLLSNYSEIAERINAKDEELQSQYKGPGLQYIRNQFLDSAAKDGYSMSNYFFSLSVMKVVMLCFLEAENYNQYDFSWDIIPLQTSLFWNGDIKFDADRKFLKYEGQNTDTSELFEQIKEHCIVNKYHNEISDENSNITAIINNETQFLTTKLDFEFSETEVKINNSYFNYQEKLSINRKY